MPWQRGVMEQHLANKEGSGKAAPTKKVETAEGKKKERKNASEEEEINALAKGQKKAVGPRQQSASNQPRRSLSARSSPGVKTSRPRGFFFTCCRTACLSVLCMLHLRARALGRRRRRR